MSQSPVLAVAVVVFRNRKLALELTRRELVDQHVSQIGGGLWLFLHPLLLFAVYAVLFTFVFQVRIGTLGPSDYLVYLFSGLGPWLLTQDVMVRSASSLILNASIVKKVMFPIEVLVAKTMASGLLIQSVMLAATLVFIALVRGVIPTTWILLPILVGLHLMFLWGLSLLLATMTSYFRDIVELLRVFVTINLYLMPVTYLPNMLPGKLGYLLQLNPFAHIIWCYQDILYFNSIDHPVSWVVLFLISIFMLQIGSYTFVRLKQFLASVL